MVTPDSDGGDARRAYQGFVRRNWLVIGACALVLIACALTALGMGATRLPVADTVSALLGRADATTQVVIWRLRMPRILTAIVGGFGLGVAGCAFQSVLRNPLASPSTLGIAQGAAFGASVAIILLGAGAQVVNASLTQGGQGASPYSSPYLVTVCAFIGSMLSTLVVLGLSRFRQITPESMILAGVALSALFSGGATLIQYFASDVQIASVVFWTFGDLGRTTYKEIAIIAVVTLVTSVFFLVHRWDFNAMEGGETSAIGLGVNANSVRLWTMAAGSLVTATVVSFVGIISFIGLIAPHIMRRFVSSDNRHLLPASGLMGAILLVLSDLFARMVISPITLPIGAITSFLGAPLFLYLLYRGVNR